MNELLHWPCLSRYFTSPEGLWAALTCMQCTEQLLQTGVWRNPGLRAVLPRGCTRTWGTAETLALGIGLTWSSQIHLALRPWTGLLGHLGLCNPLKQKQLLLPERSKTGEGKKGIGMASSSGIRGVLNRGSGARHVTKIYLLCSWSTQHF